jgi:hypothetical protein
VRAGVTLAVLLAAAAAGCGSQSTGGVSSTGLVGKVVISPATPVCRTGSSCSRPAAGAKLVFSAAGTSGSVRTDRRGNYRIDLAPGRYAVRLATSRRGARLRPASATVPEMRHARVTFTYDPGIR